MQEDPNPLSNPQLKDKHELAASVGKGTVKVYEQCCFRNTKAFFAVFKSATRSKGKGKVHPRSDHEDPEGE